MCLGESYTDIDRLCGSDRPNHGTDQYLVQTIRTRWCEYIFKKLSYACLATATRPT